MVFILMNFGRNDPWMALSESYKFGPCTLKFGKFSPWEIKFGSLCSKGPCGIKKWQIWSLVEVWKSGSFSPWKIQVLHN